MLSKSREDTYDRRWKVTRLPPARKQGIKFSTCGCPGCAYANRVKEKARNHVTRRTDIDTPSMLLYIVLPGYYPPITRYNDTHKQFTINSLL